VTLPHDYALMVLGVAVLAHLASRGKPSAHKHFWLWAGSVKAVRLTPSALDAEDSPLFSSISLDSSFYCSQALSQPVPLPVKHTISRKGYTMPVIFQQIIDSPWTELSPIRVGKIPAGLGTPDVFVLYEGAGGVKLRIDVYADRGEESICFQEAILWRNWLAIGYGHKFHLVPTDQGLPITISLESYFGHLYPTDTFLLVATARKLHCFSHDGTKKWSSPELGIDGVVVIAIDQYVILGDGEWDPPGGWKPFKVRLTSGELVET
jgi:hypothetical protein